MLNWMFGSISEQNKRDAIKELVHAATPRGDFYILIFLSVVVAAFGLHLNSAPIIIGSMLIAPILFPLMGISLGLSTLNYPLLTRSLWALAKSTFIGIVAAALVTYFFYGIDATLTPELLSRSEASLAYFVIALAAGLAVAFSSVKPELSSLLPGVAVTVALVPPLAAVGINAALWKWQLATGALALFALNVGAVIVASFGVFLLMNLYAKHNLAERAVEHEDKKVKYEQKKDD